MLTIDHALLDLEHNKDNFMDTFFRLLRQPSISATGEGVRECADLLVTIMQQQGIAAKVMETAGLPVVYGEVISNPQAPTVLIYGHYDVQPADPLDQWSSPPFEPTIRNGKVFARGSGDNKGQILGHILGVGALLRSDWPDINVKFLIDGEEESGSPNLPDFIERHRELLQADVAVSSDGPKHESGRPVVFFGVRGLLYVELVIKGAQADFHSGNKGGILPMPAWELVKLLAGLSGPDGKCMLPGFYDDVLPPSEYEQRLLATLPFEKETFLEITGLSQTELDAASYWRQLMFEPTFNICGLTSGYQGAGSKTIIPARASAKIDMRLVPNQDPEKILSALQAYLEEHAPGVELISHGSYLPSYTSVELPASQIVIAAAREAFGQEPVIQPRLGGSAPDYLMTKHLGLPSIWVPYANADENNHSPNENIGVEDFLSGIRSTVYILSRLAENL